MASKQEIIDAFDPSDVGLDNGQLFGFPFDYDTADIIVLGIPWEVTVSYRTGTAHGPESVLNASPQLDFYDLDNPEGWHQGIFMEPISQSLMEKNQDLRQQASRVIATAEQGIGIHAEVNLVSDLAAVNSGCKAMNQWVFDHTCKAIEQKKRVIVVGGDHSVPLGYLQALGHIHKEFGILQIDAHADLRNAYEGFQYSHASIMFNALKLPHISKLVQVGIRDISQTEVGLVNRSNQRIVTHFDAVLKQRRYAGIPWITLCQEIVAALPHKVYVSFDIDGLDPKLCPQTGTPVPGGLELEEAICLLREVVKSDRQIIGADLCEVGNGEWDGNVGARILYKLCNLMGL
ncbi:MAG: agmatinase family protein [Cyanobacteria bacterium P01_F01_bin.150]